MVHIFLSDVHLGAFSAEQNQQLENELIRLVDHCESNNFQIHILGDLFDYWMEFPDYIPELGQAVLDRFEKYNRVRNNDTTFITGNHDYWTVSHFEERGFNVEHEFIELELDQRKILMCHGDGLTDEKFGLSRPFLHRFIRHPKFVNFYKTVLTAETGVHLMKSFSAFTRDEEFVDTERLSTWVESLMQKLSYEVIITGHDHVPRMETFSGGTYINTGAFCKHKTVIKYTKESFNLVTWVDEANEFQPFSKSV